MKTHIPFLLILCAPLAAQTGDVSGDWIFTLTRFGQPDYRRMKIDRTDGTFSAKVMGTDLKGTLQGDKIQFDCTYEEDKETKSCGKLTGTVTSDRITGAGKMFDTDVTWTAERESRSRTEPQRHEFIPTKFHRQFNGNTPAALHINPGDTVHTKAVDAGGRDENNVPRSLGGNPLTGPFYVEGAFPGDTLVVRLNRVRLNRDSAGIFNDSIVYGAVDPYYARDMKPAKGFDSSWKLDRESGYATLSKPTDKLKNYRVKLQPMLGCIGVAPPNRQAFQSGNLGRYGGNMDYNQVREGATVYLPVFQRGALLFMGDGHAAQGDGELTGNALETSTEIEFTVDLIRGKSLGQPRFENDEYVMVSGIAGSLNEALQMATTGLSRWLEQEYKLNVSEIAMLLATSMHYDIAEVVDPQVHLVAKLPKTALAQISPALAGTWMGNMNGLPAVKLTVSDTGAQPGGSIQFYFQTRDANGKWQVAPDQGEAQPILAPRLDGNTLTFEVRHHKQHGGPEYGPNKKYVVELSGPDEARLNEVDAPATGEGLKLERQPADSRP